MGVVIIFLKNEFLWKTLIFYPTYIYIYIYKPNNTSFLKPFFPSFILGINLLIYAFKVQCLSLTTLVFLTHWSSQYFMQCPCTIPCTCSSCPYDHHSIGWPPPISPSFHWMTTHFAINPLDDHPSHNHPLDDHISHHHPSHRMFA